MTDHPVIVIGAGPIGLAAAAHLHERGLDVLVLEAGSSAGAAVREWGHIRLFSPWSELVDPAAERLLAANGWRRPPAGTFPTGVDWVAAYLEPLAHALGDRLRFGARVTAVTRSGRDRVVDAGRDSQPLTVHVVDAAGGEGRLTARAVIDASGTWSSPNPLGGDGRPAIGEQAADKHISYRMPDLGRPAVRDRFAGRHVVVAGSGHSALTALVALAALNGDAPGTRVTWVLRRGATGNVFGGGDTDQLPARGALGQRARTAVKSGHIDVVTGFRTVAVEPEDDDDHVRVIAEDGRAIAEVDRIIALTGFRPDHSLASELRLNLDERVEAPVTLAPLIDPNIHSCGTVYPHGVNELSHSERDVYLAGMKSYGRAPTFLAMTGFEQVRSIAAALAGDIESAERVELTLPATGVCGGAGLFDESATDDSGAAGSSGGCCTPRNPVSIEIGVR